MGDASLIIGSIMNCFVGVFNAVLSTDFWCGFSWGDICITFLAIDMVLGFVLWKIGHRYDRPAEIEQPVKRYDAPVPPPWRRGGNGD